MSSPTDIIGRRNQIKDYLIAGNLERAIPKLIDLARDIAPDTEEEDMAISISFKFNDNKRRFRNGDILEEQHSISNTKLVSQILTFLRELIANIDQYERATQ